MRTPPRVFGRLDVPVEGGQGGQFRQRHPRIAIQSDQPAGDATVPPLFQGQFHQTHVRFGQFRIPTNDRLQKQDRPVATALKAGCFGPENIQVEIAFEFFIQPPNRLLQRVPLPLEQVVFDHHQFQVRRFGKKARVVFGRMQQRLFQRRTEAGGVRPSVAEP